MGVSRRSYLSQCGASEVAVSKANATVRIITPADGTIDLARVNAE